MKLLTHYKMYLASAFFLLFSASTAFAVNTPTNVDPSNAITLNSLYGVSFDQDVTLTLSDVMNKSRKEIEHKLNTKLSFKQKMALKFSKYRIKKMQKNGDNVAEIFPIDSGGFNIGAFLLGFFLSFVGVLIAWLVWPEEGGLKYSLYGLGLNVLIWIGIITLGVLGSLA